MKLSNHNEKNIIKRYRAYEKLLETFTLPTTHIHFNFLTEAVHLRKIGYTLLEIAKEMDMSLGEFFNKLDQATVGTTLDILEELLSELKETKQ